MHTKDFLAQELEKAGLSAMAVKAKEGWYHDYLSPIATPCAQLEADLRTAGTAAAEALRQRHLRGEFDASSEESDAWMESKEGQQAMSELSPTMRKMFE